MDGKVVQLSLREFTDQLLPIARELFSALFPPRTMARVTEAFADIIENYGKRPWDDVRYRYSDEQLAAEFTQVVNEHILRHVAGTEVVPPEGSIPATTSVADSTASATGGACAVAGSLSREEQGARMANTVPSYVMKVFAEKRDSATRGDRHEVWRLDDDDDDEEGGDDGEDAADRVRSAAALFRSAFQPELAPDQPNWAFQSACVQFAPKGAHNDPFDFGPLPGGEKRTANWMEWEWEDLRPFDFDAPHARRDTDAVVDNRARIRRRIQSHADSIALHQHRTAVFSLVVIHREFRVVRWDPSGVCVSERVDYVRDTRALVEVLLAFVAMDEEGQGYDPTATLLPKGSEDYELMDRVVDESYCRLPVLPWAEGTPLPPTVPVQTYVTVTPNVAPPADADLYEYLVDDAQAQHDGPPRGGEDSSPAETTTTTRRVLKDGSFVFQYVLDYFRRSLARGFLRYKLRIGSDEFLVGAPLYFAVRFGATRGYVAFHKQSGRFVLLKDSWRPRSLGGVGCEGDILRTLNKDEVRNVPILLCHGVMDGQVTRVLDYWMDLEDQREKEGRKTVAKTSATGGSENEPRSVKRARDDPDRESEMPQIRHYVHQRTVLKEVCLPLSAITSSRQLVSVVGDCIEAHYDATKKSKLIHRNISSEGIAILPTFVEPDGRDGSALCVVWRGILADWESATPVPAHGADPWSTQQPERTPAAWRHMSVASLTDASHTKTADEIESFFYAVLHHAIRFCPHNVNATDFINMTFIPYTRLSDGAILCPLNKEFIVGEYGALELHGVKVVFYQPGQSGSRNAPLNRLLFTVLRWLKARYYVVKYETSPRRSSISVIPSTSNSDLPAKRQRVELGPSNEAIITDSASGPSASADDDWRSEPVRPSDQTYELASRVDDHKAVRELFGQVKSMDWPENDVVGDQWIRERFGPFY